MQQCWDRVHWQRKKDINRVLRLRAADPNNQGQDWAACSSTFHDTGAVYAIYHFTSGRWYVGQTVGTVHKRAQEHWQSRKRCTDAFHQALALDDSPFCFIAFPLEWIPAESYIYPGQRRKERVKKFRAAATPRERYWVDKLNSLWPHGWNSTVPGRPVAAYVLRRHNLPSGPTADDDEKQRFVEDWPRQWRSNPEAAIQAATKAPKDYLRDTLHHLQARFSPDELLSNGQSPTPLLIAELRRRREEPSKRQFLRFKFTSNEARDLQLRSVLRNPVVYHKHPEPDAAAAIMVSDSFDPQIQGFLFNYTEAAKELNLATAA